MHSFARLRSGSPQVSSRAWLTERNDFKGMIVLQEIKSLATTLLELQHRKQVDQSKNHYLHHPGQASLMVLMRVSNFTTKDLETKIDE
jgi:hypothetical protein